MCITPDDSNRKVAYNCTIGALQQKGYTVKEIGHRTNDPNCDAILDCQTVSRWDVANFTSDIKYEWYEDGTKIGRCHYQAKSGLNFTKFINTQEKVNDLLNKLLPNLRNCPVDMRGSLPIGNASRGSSAFLLQLPLTQTSQSITETRLLKSRH